MSTVLNPGNTGYDLTKVPPTKTDRSRFALAKTAEGWDVSSPSDAIAASYERLAIRLKESAAEPLVPARKRVALKWVAREADGTWAARDRGTVEAIPTFAGTAPSRFAKTQASAGALVDELLLGPGNEAWEKARDEDVWEALLELCRTEEPSSETTRQLNNTVALAVLLRHGVDAEEMLLHGRLPQEHLREQTTDGEDG